MSALHALRQWSTVHSADYPFEPPSSNVAVDGLRVDALRPEPGCIHDEARRDLIEKRFQPLLSLMVHNH